MGNHAGEVGGDEVNGYDLDAPADVFLVSMAGTTGAPRVLWRMSTKDAMSLCERPETAGQLWMICWTQQMLIELEAKNFATDDGRFDGLLSDLGITVLCSRKMLMDGSYIAAAIQPAPPEPARMAGQLDMFAQLEKAS